MSIKTFAISVFFMVCIGATACTPATLTDSMASANSTPSMTAQTPALMDSTPTAAMMDAQPTDTMMDAKPTDAMMDAKPTDAMMDAKPTDTMMDVKPTDDGSMGMKPTDSSMGMPDTSGMGQKMDANPAWFKLTLSDARTGENFTIADFAGKVILLENMAASCPNCLEQQNQIKMMLQQMGMVDGLVVIGLDVDPKEDAALLTAYVEKNGFDWKYAVATPEVAKEISTLYGAQFLNPTPTPVIIIDRAGNIFLQDFGIKSAGTLQKSLAPHLAMK